MKDYLGNKIEVGMRAVRGVSGRSWNPLQKCTVTSVNGNTIGVLTDGNNRPGNTHADRLIVETGFNSPI